MDEEITTLLLLTVLAISFTIVAFDLKNSQSLLWWGCGDLIALFICHAASKSIISQKEMRFQKGVKNHASNN
jgi:hypothetical protein